ncbi:hypothetical protein EDD37DRAFT_336376 [Exophiala viscosa]|uniref:Uncharacterized protein n=1 Tax=Exophiala viscosa TaxID=2486360 RepID=A0AAN6DV08_9EURO|nr:hypothetical protein EDD36DRAFT_465316 [Exophiala viscosa]KAI1626258.1 hypothetical protein EDD37DRAFT_336376 [Exophiala viscosa]
MAEPGFEPVRPGNPALHEDMAEINSCLPAVLTLCDEASDKLKDHDAVLQKDPQSDSSLFLPWTEDITALRTMADIARAGTKLPPTESMGKVAITLRRMAEIKDTLRIIGLVPDLEIEDVWKLKDLVRHLDELSNLSKDESDGRIMSGAEDEAMYHTFDALDDIKTRCQERRAAAAAREAKEQQEETLGKELLQQVETGGEHPTMFMSMPNPICEDDEEWLVIMQGRQDPSANMACKTWSSRD